MNPVREKQTRKLFIDAALGIIESSGVQGVTIRAVAARCGYSCAALYSHFKNIDHLLWHAAMAYIDELGLELAPFLSVKPGSLSNIEGVYTRYAAYFIERPEAFRLIFFHDLGEPPEEFSALSPEPRLASVLLENYLCPLPGRRKLKADIPLMARTLTAAIHGTLALFLSGKSGKTSKEVLGDIHPMLEFLLRDFKKERR
jgi:AcrR family transcriptional regulator